MITRDINDEVLLLAREFPVVAILGPRQSGKTTLSRSLFSSYQYVSLENPDSRDYATADPRGFLSRYKKFVIIDEIQYCPELFSYLQEKVDMEKETGRFIITGSQNYLMVEKISQSLAGRVGIATLLPFSLNETKHYINKPDADHLIVQGSYPPVYDRNIRPASFYATYLSTYIERDVRSVLNITDYSRFTKFLRLLAGRCGQLLNKNEIAVEAGISHTTVENWISVLETSYIVFRLQPWFKNFNKRIVKQPKLYFYDTGLVSYLLGLKEPNDVSNFYMRGPLFENMVISNFFKENFNCGFNINYWFWRDNHKKEIDLLIDKGSIVKPIEIKSGETFKSDQLSGLKYWCSLSGTKPEDAFLIYGGIENMNFKGINIVSWTLSDEILKPQVP